MRAEHTYCQQCGADLPPGERGHQPCRLCQTPAPEPLALFALESDRSIRASFRSGQSKVEMLVSQETMDFQDAETRVGTFRIGIKRHSWRQVARERILQADQRVAMNHSRRLADIWSAVY